jgi:lysophospholipase L1-like esterase
MRGRMLAFLSVAALAAAVPAAAAAATNSSGAGAKTATPRYYLALGDSLSQGMQPDLKGVTRDTDQGYTNDLFTTEQARVHNLQLVKLGCGGDTSASLLTGHGNDTNARVLHCDRNGGSQLTAATRFLKTHHQAGEVPLVTIDIGANDVDGCATATNVATCVTQGTAAIGNNVPKILSALKRAAPAGTTFAGMTLYDPVLGGYFSTDPSVRGLALASPALLKLVNAKLAAADQKAGFKTADVAGAFDSYDSTDKVTWENQQIPVNVARVCSWTWACQTPPSGPNIHANKNGYVVIAGAFAKVIGSLK